MSGTLFSSSRCLSKTLFIFSATIFLRAFVSGVLAPGESIKDSDSEVNLSSASFIFLPRIANCSILISAVAISTIFGSSPPVVLTTGRLPL